MKYSKISAVVRWGGGTMVLHKGMSFDDEHGLVRQRPDLFTDEAPGADRPAVPEAGPVERATRAPGERRRGPLRKPTSKEG